MPRYIDGEITGVAETCDGDGIWHLLASVAHNRGDDTHLTRCLLVAPADGDRGAIRCQPIDEDAYDIPTVDPAAKLPRAPVQRETAR